MGFGHCGLWIADYGFEFGGLKIDGWTSKRRGEGCTLFSLWESHSHPLSSRERVLCEGSARRVRGRLFAAFVTEFMRRGWGGGSWGRECVCVNQGFGCGERGYFVNDTIK